MSTTPPKYGLFGNLKAQIGKGDELATILVAASSLVSTAKGCHIYLVSRDSQDDTLIWINEVWETKEDHDNSLQVPGVRQLINQALPLLAGQPEKGLVLQVLGGKGLD